MLFPETVKHVCWWHVRAAASSYSRTVVQSYSRLPSPSSPSRNSVQGGRLCLVPGACTTCLLVPLSLFIAVIIKVALHGIDR